MIHCCPARSSHKSTARKDSSQEMSKGNEEVMLVPESTKTPSAANLATISLCVCVTHRKRNRERERQREERERERDIETEKQKVRQVKGFAIS